MKSILRSSRRSPRDERNGKRGQSLVEFAVAVPVFMALLLGMLEFGFVFTHNLALEYATREGARMAAALGKGTDQVVCADVDKNIIAALQRVVNSPDSQVKVGNISQIKIYRADINGAEIAGDINVWNPGTGPLVDGVALKFLESSNTWNACSRNNSWSRVAGVDVPPDSIGVALTYTYDFITPLGNIVRAFASGTLTMSDKTVMAINPT